MTIDKFEEAVWNCMGFRKWRDMATVLYGRGSGKSMLWVDFEKYCRNDVGITNDYFRVLNRTEEEENMVTLKFYYSNGKSYTAHFVTSFTESKISGVIPWGQSHMQYTQKPNKYKEVTNTVPLGDVIAIEVKRGNATIVYENNNFDVSVKTDVSTVRQRIRRNNKKQKQSQLPSQEQSGDSLSEPVRWEEIKSFGE